LAKSLESRRESARDRDRTGTKSKKAAALAALKKERKIQIQQRDASSDESELDFGDDDDDSDEDYEESGLKPWQKKKQAAKSTVSRLDQDHESGEDMDIDEDDDEDQAQRKESSRPSADKTSAGAADAGLEDFMKVTIPRRRLARWCNEPFFEAAVLECFVRLFIGEDDSGAKVYRLCEIIDVNTSNKTNKFPVAKKTDKPISTNKTLRLKFGTSERDFPMYLVSDAPPEELDVQKYITTQKNNRLDILSKRRANKLRRLQDDLVNNYTYTTEDIERNLDQRKKQGKSVANLGSEQTKVAIVVQAARESVKELGRRVAESKKALMESDSNLDEAQLTSKVREDEKALESAKKLLEVRLEAERATSVAVKERIRRLTGRAKDQNWAKVNERALLANQRADRDVEKLSKVAGSATKKEFNPYARRKVKPKILWEVGQSRGDEKAEEKKDSGEEATKGDKTKTSTDVATPSLVQESQGKAAALRDRHQFAIDEESLAQSTTIDGILGGTRKKDPKKNRVRKGISLAEYQERKQNGTL
jgi:RNA polymerase-associated protein RTF1